MVIQYCLILQVSVDRTKLRKEELSSRKILQSFSHNVVMVRVISGSSFVCMFWRRCLFSHSVHICQKHIIMSEHWTWHYLNYCSLLKASMPCSMRCEDSVTNEWRNLRQWSRSLRRLVCRFERIYVVSFPCVAVCGSPVKIQRRVFVKGTYVHI